MRPKAATCYICCMSYIWRLLVFFTCTAAAASAQAPDPSILKVKAPETFRASFKTTKGEFVVEAYREWSPLGVDRLYQLVRSGYFNNSILFRVEPRYVVQFGVADTHPEKLFWDRKRLKDEPVKQKHTKGIIAYARDVKDSRSTQLFVNMVDNPKLDTIVLEGVKGFTPIARVIRGMENLARLHAEYGKRPAAIQDSLYKYGNPFFEMLFPNLDKIIYARIIP
jgi:peptidyl-prolyl cis-trans isomerase A (cyclophilin A)